MDDLNVQQPGRTTGIYRRIGFNRNLGFGQMRSKLNLPDAANIHVGMNRTIAFKDNFYLYHSMWRNQPYVNPGVEAGLWYRESDAKWLPYVRRSWIPANEGFYIHYNRQYPPGSAVEMTVNVYANQVVLTITSSSTGTPPGGTTIVLEGPTGFSATGDNIYPLRITGIAQRGDPPLPSTTTQSRLCSVVWSDTKMGEAGSNNLTALAHENVWEVTNNPPEPRVIRLRNKTGLNETVSIDTGAPVMP